MPSGSPFGFLVCKPLTLGENSPTQDSATLNPREASAFFHPVTITALLSGILITLIPPLALSPRQTVRICRVLHNWKGRQTPLCSSPLVFSCDTPSLPLGVKEVGMEEAWVGK